MQVSKEDKQTGGMAAATVAETVSQLPILFSAQLDPHQDSRAGCIDQGWATNKE